MITQDTLFILGAGASVPYGYPTGNELREEIYKRSIGSDDFRKFFRDDPLGFSDAEYNKWMEESKSFTDIFFRSSTYSIDLFLNRNPQFEEIGKTAITHRILTSEQRSRFNEHIPEAYRDQNWYQYLFHRMTNTLTTPDSYRQFGENKVTFITFNYDRSLEHYLFDSLFNSFYESAKETNGLKGLTDQLNKIPIYHLYGCIGKLPWQGASIERTYGFDFKFEDIMEMKKNIKIIYEKRNKEMDEVRGLIKKARNIFFLGFGFAKENMAILGLPKTTGQHQFIYATAYGMSDREIYNVRHPITTLDHFVHLGPEILDGKIIFKDTDCLSLLRDHL